MGLPILSPCSRLFGRPALHPSAVCSSPCMSATSVPGVMEKNEEAKNGVWGGEKAERSRVKKNPYCRKMNGDFKVAKP